VTIPLWEDGYAELFLHAKNRIIVISIFSFFIDIYYCLYCRNDERKPTIS